MKSQIKSISSEIHRFLQGGVSALRDSGEFVLSTLHPNHRKLKKEIIQQIALLDSLEKQPITFNSKNINTQFVIEVLDKSKHLLGKADQVLHQSTHQLQSKLSQRVAALSYRLEEINGGSDPERVIDYTLYAKLSEEAAVWKQGIEIFIHKFLTESQKQALRATVRYPAFAKLLLQDASLREHFFLWALRDGISPIPFIQFPAHCENIVRSSLNGRIGRTGGNALKIEKIPSQDKGDEKVLTLPFEGVSRSILDEKQVIEFRGNYRLTIEEIFLIFKEKNVRVGNLEWMADGVINWNVHQLGWWDTELGDYHRIDLDQDAWWNQLPAMEVLTLSQARERYGKHADGIHWSCAATATRGTESLDFENCHAFLEVAIPRQDGKYDVYDFGKFAYRFPATFYQNLTLFSLTLHATIAYPDENVYYSHRQHIQQPFGLNAEEGVRLMSEIRADIINAREKNLVYQIESENCAKWALEKIQTVVNPERIPNLFRINLLKTEPIGLVAGIFAFIRKLPSFLHVPAVTGFHIPFGARDGEWVVENGQRVWRSLATHDFWETVDVYLPAMLHKQVLDGVLGEAILSDSVLERVTRMVWATLSNLSRKWQRSFAGVFAAFFSIRNEEISVFSDDSGGGNGPVPQQQNDSRLTQTNQGSRIANAIKNSLEGADTDAASYRVLDILSPGY